MSEIIVRENRLLLGSETLDADLRHPALYYIASLQSVSSQETMRGVLNLVAVRLADWFGIDGVTDLLSFPWENLEAQHITYYMRVRDQRDGCKYTTINKELAAIKGVMMAAWDLQLIDTDRLQRIQRIKSARGSSLLAGRAVKEDELDALFHYLSEVKKRKPNVAARDAAIFSVLYMGGGPRREEVVDLDVTDFDEDEGTIEIRHGKGNKSRLCYLSLPNKEAVKAWIGVLGKTDGPLFGPIDQCDRIQFDGGELPRLTLWGLNHIVKRRCRQAGISHATPHDFRRTAITHMLDKRADVTVVQKAVGHKNASTTWKYNRQEEAKLERTSRMIRAPYEG